MVRISSFFFLAFFLTAALTAQDEPIYLTNASFEDMPRHSKPPRGWFDCGFRGESPPDVQPSGTFSVTKPPHDGNTYMGMVVRDNDTWETVSQALSRPLQKGQCYEFSIYLARSELYVSTSRITDETANYTTPAKLRIYGGSDYCDKAFLLGETNLVINTRWLEYRFKFEPDADYTHLIFEAFYKTPTLFPYNGNILIDDASPIRPIPCDEEEIIAEESPQEEDPVVEEVTEASSPPAVKPPQQEEKTGKQITPPPTIEKPAVETVAVPQSNKQEVIENVTFSNIKRTDFKEGTTIRIDNLFFQADKWVITSASHQTLDELYAFLNKNPDVVIEIGGHTNGLPSDYYCDNLSNNRARAVAEYLAEKGIDRRRLQYKGYGKRQPIASDDTPEGRRKNQRVEIKILSVKG